MVKMCQSNGWQAGTVKMKVVNRFGDDALMMVEKACQK